MTTASSTPKIKIDKRTDAKGKTRYLARYFAPDGRKISAGTFGDRKSAERAALLAADKAATTQWVDPRSGKITFRQFVEHVYEPTMGGLEASTRRGYKAMLRTHLLPYWGDKTLSSIRPSMVAAWVNDPNPKRAYPDTPNGRRLAEKPRSVQKALDCYGLLHKILQVAVDDQAIVGNPCTGLNLPTEPKPKVKIVTPAQFEALIAEVKNTRNRAMLLTLCMTGMRWSELAALCPAQIDFLRRVITCDRGLVNVGKTETGTDSRWLSKPYPKGEEERTITLRDQEVLDALSAQIAARGLEADSEEPIFLSRNGTPMDSTHFNTDVLKPALKKIGLEGKGITIKTLRASYCSWLLDQGAPLSAVQKLMGHKQVTTTQKYIGVLDSTLEDAADLLANFRQSTKRSKKAM